MKKLLDLKHWLTVPDTARYLSIIFGEEVREPGVLRLGLDGHLTLSVDFVNHAEGRLGRVIPNKDAKRDYVLSLREDGALIELIDGLVIDDDRVIELDSKILEIDGVWDLAMLGAERLDVEHRYHILTDGPIVELSNLHGPLVRRNDGTYCQIMNH